jgi:hypothetical protein
VTFGGIYRSWRWTQRSNRDHAHRPDEWTTFNTRSLFRGSLLGQKKYAEAEPLSVSGYEGMKARSSQIRHRL